MSVPLLTSAVLGISVLGAISTHRPKPKPKARHHLLRRAPQRRSIPLQHAPGSRAEAYAALTEAACIAELGRRHIPFSQDEPKRGVKIPVRLTGRVGGVLYRTDYPDAQRASTPFEIFDCRLVLSLDDFSEILRRHSIAEVRIFSAWRPPNKNWPMDQWARRHPGALAVDVRELRKDTGEVLNVLEHFHGSLAKAWCGPGASPPVPDAPEARELREIVCGAVDARLFNSVLSPNYDRAHHNHFHLELTPGVDWFMVR